MKAVTLRDEASDFRACTVTTDGKVMWAHLDALAQKFRAAGASLDRAVLEITPVVGTPAEPITGHHSKDFTNATPMPPHH